MDIELDPENGFIYSIKISLTNKFSKYAKWTIYSTTKQNIKKELLEKIVHFDFQNKKSGSSTNQIKKRVKSTALKIECYCCGKEKPVVGGFHRNLFSPLFKDSRNGYCFTCFDCLYGRAIEIERLKDFHTSITFICGVLDRPYISTLVETVSEMDIQPVLRYGEYIKRLNLVSKVKNNGNTFANSDLFE